MLTKEEWGKQLPQVVHKTGRCLECDLIPRSQRKVCLHPVDPIQNACKAGLCSIKRPVNITMTASSIACVVKCASAAVNCKDLCHRHAGVKTKALLTVFTIGQLSDVDMCVHGMQLHA